MRSSLAVMIICVLAVMSCVPRDQVRNENINTEETRNLASFDEVSVGNSIKLTLEKGNSNTARIETSDVDTEEVVIKVSGSSLNIYMKKGSFGFWGTTSWRGTIEVYLTYTENLKTISASNSSSVKSNTLMESDEFYIRASNSATIDLKVNAEELELNISNSGRMRLDATTENLEAKITNSGKLSLNGETNSQKIYISNSGYFSGYDMQSERVDATIRNSGSAEVSVSKKLVADASNSGKIYYKGNPDKLQADTGNGAKVERAD